jgi:hypothetical protein
MRFLIVNDNCKMRKMLAFYLRDLADEISDCCDGAERFKTDC